MAQQQSSAKLAFGTHISEADYQAIQDGTKKLGDRRLSIRKFDDGSCLLIFGFEQTPLSSELIYVLDAAQKTIEIDCRLAAITPTDRITWYHVEE